MEYLDTSHIKGPARKECLQRIACPTTAQLVTAEAAAQRRCLEGLTDPSSGTARGLALLVTGSGHTWTLVRASVYGTQRDRVSSIVRTGAEAIVADDVAPTGINGIERSCHRRIALLVQKAFSGGKLPAIARHVGIIEVELRDE